MVVPYEKLTPLQHHHLTEHLTLLIASRLLKSGDGVLDVGANIGFHARGYASCVKPDGIVHAFEPNPTLWKHLIDIELVRLWPVAVGDTMSIETFFEPSDEYNQAGSINDPRQAFGNHIPVREISVPQVSLDSIPEIAATSIQFVKIDVEGRELQVLRGGRQILEKNRPLVIFEAITTEIEDFFGTLLYDCKTLLPNSGREYLANFVAIPRERSELIKLLPNEDEAALKVAEAIEAYPAKPRERLLNSLRKIGKL